MALLLSINPKWVLFGALGICVGSILWEIDELKQAEVQAERERLVATFGEQLVIAATS